MKVVAIIPVSPFEPIEIILDSVKHLKSLDWDNFDYELLYVVDKRHNNDSRVEILKRENIRVLERNTTRGKRGGAINDALNVLGKVDYIAIFDVDSRPEKDFIVKCVEALQKHKNAYIASSRRYISNPVNLVSETIETEYYFINFLLKKSAFKQFNGLIGVLRAELLIKYRLNEDVITEDADFATRMHFMGYKAILVENTKIFEQAPIKWKDLYNQRKRWYYGGLQLWRYWKYVRKSNFKFAISWFSALTLTYVILVIAPFLILAPPLLLYKFRKIKKLVVVVGLFIHTLILQFAAITALINFIKKRGVEWDQIERVT
ncbi:glycosyltransferase family 2 protein [Archaeoglobales archaeon]|nr:MAG: glycosyltransferase family 2 protein [Archaeoglobales archaeon]